MDSRGMAEGLAGSFVVSKWTHFEMAHATHGELTLYGSSQNVDPAAQ
jgi:hypothetical protein